MSNQEDRILEQVPLSKASNIPRQRASQMYAATFGGATAVTAGLSIYAAIVALRGGLTTLGSFILALGLSLSLLGVLSAVQTVLEFRASSADRELRAAGLHRRITHLGDLADYIDVSLVDSAMLMDSPLGERLAWTREGLGPSGFPGPSQLWVGDLSDFQLNRLADRCARIGNNQVAESLVELLAFRSELMDLQVEAHIAMEHAGLGHFFDIPRPDTPHEERRE